MAAAAESDTSSDTCSSSDLAPRMQAQFNNLSSVLAETSENLLSFEFLLGQYRQQVARVRPTQQQQVHQQQQEGHQGQEVDKDVTGKLESLLSDLATAVNQVGAMKEGLSSHRSSNNDQEVEDLKRSLEESAARIAVLERECREKEVACQQMTEAAHRSRAALEEERCKSAQLDEKLERERRAAKKVGEDITRYVAQMKSLEEEVAALKREKRRNKSKTSAAVDMSGDVLTATIVEQEPEHDEQELARKLEQERTKNRELAAKVSRFERQEIEYQRQLQDLKDGLESLQRELEDKVSHNNNDFEVNFDKNAEGLRQRLESSEESLRSLKSKSKKLLKQYQKKKEQMQEQAQKVSMVRDRLTDIEKLFNNSERRQAAILNYMGSQTEVSARLLAAYLGVDLKQEQPVQMSDRKLSEWFADVQSLSTWLQEQIVSFGKRLWTGQEAINFEILPPPELQSRKDKDDIGETVKLQETAVGERRQAMLKLKEALSHE